MPAVTAVSRGAFARAGAASALAAGLLATLITVPVPRAAATEPADGVPAISVIAAPANGGVVRDGDELTVRVTVTNATGAALEGARAQLRVDPEPLADQEAVRAWLTNESTPDIPAVVTAELVTVAPTSTAVTTLTLAADDLDLDDTFGVRAVGVAVLDGAGAVIAHDRTAVVGQPLGTTAAGAGVVVIAPLTAPDARGRFLSADQLTELTAPGGRLSRTLDAAAARGVALGVDPRILASIRVLGDAAPASAVALLERLSASGLETFALRYADADPLSAVGTLPIAAPPALGAGSIVLDDETGAEQDLAQLTAWEHRLDGWAWPIDGTLGRQAVDPLIADGTRMVIGHSADLESGHGPVGQLADDLAVLVADPLATELVRHALADGSTQARRAAVAELSALLATAPATSEPLVAIADRTAAPGPSLERLIDEVTALPWGRTGVLAPTTSSGIGAEPVTLVDRTTNGADGLDELLALEAGDAEFARIALDPAPLIADRRLDLLDGLAVGGEDASAAIARYAAESQRLRDAVQVVESNTITLAGDRTSLPVTVQNGLPVDVRVFVRVEPATGALRVEDRRVEAIVPAAAQVRALVPVQSLVNGDVDIRVSLRADDGEPIGASIQLSLNLQAGWETAGTIAIGGVIAALFAIGLVRDIRRRRQQRASAPTDETSSS